MKNILIIGGSGNVGANLYHFFKQKDLNVVNGEFGAHMDVSLVNNGPVTYVIDTNEV